MKKLFLIALLAVFGSCLVPVSSLAQLPRDGCYDKTYSATATGASSDLLFRNSEGVPFLFRASYYTTGSPGGVSISITAGMQLVAVQSATTILAAVSNTTGALIGSSALQYRYWYADLATLSGGTNPTLVLTYCISRNVTIQTDTSGSAGGGATVASDSIVFEGASADANETTLTVTDPSADRTITLPDATGIVAFTPGIPDAATAINFAANSIVAEGATADAFETTVTFTDPGADVTVTVPTGANAAYAVIPNALTTNDVDVANSLWGVSNGLRFEGATGNAFELTVSPADVGADATATLPGGGGASYAVLGSALTTNDVDVANSIWGVSNGLRFEGLTADAFETTITPTDVAADATATLPGGAGASFALFLSALTTNDIDAANGVWGVSNGLRFEGATADTIEVTLSPTDPTAGDSTITIPNTASVAASLMISSLTTNTIGAADGVWGASNGLVFEGATADAFETTISSTDVGAAVAVTLPGGSNAAYSLFPSTLTTNDVGITNSVWGASNSIVFEGVTADAFEVTLAPADVTADSTILLPGTGGTVMLSTLATNAPDIANSITGASNALLFEGATADGFEISLAPADATSDTTVTLPNTTGTVMLSTLATNGPDIANSVTGASGNLVFEGSTADGFETFITATDPTADTTVTIPAAASGTMTVSHFAVSFVGGAPATIIDTMFFIADRAYIVTDIDAVWGTAEATGAMAVQVERLQGTEACTGAAGDNLLSATIDATGAAATVNNGSLAGAGVTALAIGDRLCLNVTATPNEITNLVVTVALNAN